MTRKRNEIQAVYAKRAPIMYNMVRKYQIIHYRDGPRTSGEQITTAGERRQEITTDSRRGERDGDGDSNGGGKLDSRSRAGAAPRIIPTLDERRRHPSGGGAAADQERRHNLRHLLRGISSRLPSPGPVSPPGHFLRDNQHRRRSAPGTDTARPRLSFSAGLPPPGPSLSPRISGGYISEGEFIPGYIHIGYIFRLFLPV